MHPPSAFAQLTLDATAACPPEDARALVDVDALFPKEVTKVVLIEYLHATTKGVRIRRVLVVTRLSTARLL